MKPGKQTGIAVGNPSVSISAHPDGERPPPTPLRQLLYDWVGSQLTPITRAPIPPAQFPLCSQWVYDLGGAPCGPSSPTAI